MGVNSPLLHWDGARPEKRRTISSRETTGGAVGVGDGGGGAGMPGVVGGAPAGVGGVLDPLAGTGAQPVSTVAARPAMRSRRDTGRPVVSNTSPAYA
ncbi:hypothetical protein GCM10028815_04290 [Mariniluteicoccus flavus]